MLTFKSIALFIALRYMSGKTIDYIGKYIYWISSFSIALGIMSIIIILSVMNGFEHEIKNSILYFVPHILLIADKGYVYKNDIPDIKYHKYCDIIYIQPLVISNVILESSKKIVLSSMMGVDSNHFQPFSYCLINKCINRLQSDQYYIVISSMLAKQLEVKINDSVRLIIPSIRNVTPVGYIPSQRLFTVVGIYYSNNSMDDFQIFIHREDAAKLMRYPIQCITGWRLWINDPFSIDKCNQCKSFKNWMYKDWREYKGSLVQAIQIEKSMMFLLLILMIIASGLNIVSFLVLLITDKQKDIAVLKTYGLTYLQIIFLFMVQGISSGMIGTILGIGLGIFVSSYLNWILSFLPFFSSIVPLPVEIRYFQILNIISVVCIFIILVTFYPSLKAAKINPVKILRHD